MKRFFDNFEAYVCVLLLLVMTLIGFANIVIRYLTNWSFAASEELLLAGFLLVTIFGASMAARRGQHLAVTFFAGLMGRRVDKALTIFAAFVSIVLLLITAWFSFDLVRMQYATGVTTAALQLPAWYYSAAMPFGFLLMALRTFQFALHDMIDGEGADKEFSDV